MVYKADSKVTMINWPATEELGCIRLLLRLICLAVYRISTIKMVYNLITRICRPDKRDHNSPLYPFNVLFLNLPNGFIDKAHFRKASILCNKYFENLENIY